MDTEKRQRAIHVKAAVVVEILADRRSGIDCCNNVSDGRIGTLLRLV
jgi:hypothetical protein